MAATCEGRDLPSSESGLYDISEHRHLTSITTVGNIDMQIQDAITESIERCYRYVVDNLPMDTTRALQIKNAANLVQLLTTDLNQGCEVLRGMFKDLISVDYLKLAFDVYEKEVNSVCRELVETTCDKLKPIIYSESSAENDYVNDTMTIGTSLFELYLLLKQMTE